MFCDYQLCRFVSVAAIAGKLCDLGESELLESTARWVFLEHLKVGWLASGVLAAGGHFDGGHVALEVFLVRIPLACGGTGS